MTRPGLERADITHSAAPGRARWKTDRTVSYRADIQVRDGMERFQGLGAGGRRPIGAWPTLSWTGHPRSRPRARRLTPARPRPLDGSPGPRRRRASRAGKGDAASEVDDILDALGNRHLGRDGRTLADLAAEDRALAEAMQIGPGQDRGQHDMAGARDMSLLPFPVFAYVDDLVAVADEFSHLIELEVTVGGIHQAFPS